MFISDIAILYDIDIINDSYTLIYPDKLKKHNHIPNELRTFYLDNPNIIGHFCGTKLLNDSKERLDG